MTTIDSMTIDSGVSSPTALLAPVAKEGGLSPNVNENISQFLPTEVSSSEAENDDDDDDQFSDEAEEVDMEFEEQPKKPEPVKFRGRPSSCVFVASLAASLTDDDLCISVTEGFKKYGELAMVKVLRDPANRPYAFVQYTNDADARLALRQAQGSVLNGRTIRCEPARVNRTLFAATRGRSASGEISSEEIVGMMESFGEIEQLVASRDHCYRRNYYPTSKSNAWFVQFAYRDDAIRAFANLKMEPDWEVEWAQNIEVPKRLNLVSKRDPEDTMDELVEDERDCVPEMGTIAADDVPQIDKKSVFVGQLDRGVTKESLHDRFSRHGDVADINLIVKPNNVFAFIRFDTEHAAAAALEMENHAIFLGKTMHVQYREIGGGHYKKSRHASNSGYHNHGGFHTPRLNLAPPPINLGRRASTGSVFNHYNNYSLQDIQPFSPNVGNKKHGKGAPRRGSFVTGFSGFKRNFPSDASDAGQSVAGSSTNNDAPSEVPGSATDDAASTNASTAYNHYSAGGNGGMKKKFHLSNDNFYQRRGSYPNYDPYYYPPYYYPIDYPMTPIPPPPPGSGANQPYFMYYPIPPPSGVDFNEMNGGIRPPMTGPPLPPMSQPQFMPLDHSMKAENDKQVLEY